MYFVILVVIIYMNWWLEGQSKYLTRDLIQREYVRTFIVYGLVGSALKGLQLGYVLWFLYYCTINYLIPLL